MRPLPITLTCDCGATAEVGYGERWTCADCGRVWDTGQIPATDYQALVRGISRYRLLALGPPLTLAAVLIPLAVLVGIQFAFLLFVLVMAWGLLVVPQIRRRALRHLRESAKAWTLRPEP